MGWTVRLSAGAKKSLRKLDKPAAKRITAYLREKIEKGTNPRDSGKALKGSLCELWRYRVGQYRIVCRIEEEMVEVIVLRIGHRKEVYKNKA